MKHRPLGIRSKLQRKHMLIAATILMITILLFLISLRGSNATAWRRLFYKCTEGFTQPYQAPLYDCDDTTHMLFPQSYTIALYPDYTLEELKKTIGVRAALVDCVEGIGLLRTHERRLVYSCHSVDDMALAAIRKDVGVYQVNCQISYAGEEDF